MSTPYAILNALPPEAFLDPSRFRTGFDEINPAYADEQYRTGLDYSKRARRVFICANGTWGADMADGGVMTSYEGIGYHAHTASLLRGILDGPAAVIVYRKDRRDATEIKPAVLS